MSKKTILNIVIFICAAVFALSTGGFIYTLYKCSTEKALFESLAGKYHDPENPQDESSRDGAAENTDSGTAGSRASAEKHVSKAAESYANLKKENPDFVCWITIPGTVIDYPVMQNSEDPEYYLHRDFYGNNSYSGTPFLDADCSISSRVVIIYAHNMKDGTMFGELDNYRGEAFMEENSEIIIDTREGDRVFKIFGAFETTAATGGFAYADFTGDISRDNFKKLTSIVKAGTPYETGNAPQYEDNILLLSTCSYHKDNGRYIVAAYEVH